MGARVIALDTNPQRLERAREFGADELVNPGSNDPVEAIKQLTRGKYADLTLDTSSNRKPPQCHSQHQGVGHHVFVGEGGDVTIDVSPHLLRRQMTLIASWTFSTVIQASARVLRRTQDRCRRLFTTAGRSTRRRKPTSCSTSSRTAKAFS